MNTKTGRKTLIGTICLIITLVIVEIYYYFSHRVTIFADGKRITFISKTKEPLVKDILQTAKVSYTPSDIIEPPLEQKLNYPRIIKVWRIKEDIILSTSTPKITVIEKIKTSSNLRPILYKKLKITSEIIRTKVILKDGIETSREVIGREVKETYEEYLYFLDKRGKKSILTYRLNDYPKKKMIATAYYPGDPLAWRDGTITCLGMKMQRGIVAVDPRVIPLRTRLWIPGYGYGYAADTGSAIKGNRIDLGVNNADEEKPWMHKKVVVYILGRAKTY